MFYSILHNNFVYLDYKIYSKLTQEIITIYCFLFIHVYYIYLVYVYKELLISLTILPYKAGFGCPIGFQVFAGFGFGGGF